MEEEAMKNVSEFVFESTLQERSNEEETSCLTRRHHEKLEQVHVIVILVFLGLLCLAVICGNLLVIVSVFISSKLRTVTNFFIVSLAVADLCLGLVVLPYSVSLEILDVWLFGAIWCQIWLAIDVWMCTASILNLCAISVDRYVAITRPVHYRSLMSSRRAKVLIAAVWVLSFIICFPPLVGWNDHGGSRNETDLNATDFSISSFDGRVLISGENGPKDDSTLLVYFDLNTINWSLPQRDDDVLSELLTSDETAESEVVEAVEPLNPNSTTRNPRCGCSLINNKGYVVYSALGSFYIPMVVMLFFYWRIYLAALRTSRALARGFLSTKGPNKEESEKGSDVTLRMHRGKTKNAENCNARRRSGDIIIPRKRPTNVMAAKSCAKGQSGGAGGGGGLQRVGAKKYLHFTAYNNGNSASDGLLDEPLRAGVSESDRRKSNLARLSKRNIRWHARRFHSEAKATKTVGIIVGGFVCCWLPFFTAYLTRAFCESCISDTLFSVFFWLGYCNSAINPLIYGLFSKDFSRAFKRILCRCFLKKEGVSSLIRQIHMPTFFEEEDTLPDDT